MGNRVRITLFCASTQKKSKIIFEETNKNEWQSVECYAFQDPPKPKESFLSSVAYSLGLGGRPKTETIQEDETASASGVFYYNHRCPHCGKTGYVKCNTCGHISCWNPNEKMFTCGYCGNHGEVSGTIESLNVEPSEEKKVSANGKYQLS